MYRHVLSVNYRRPYPSILALYFSPPHLYDKSLFGLMFTLKYVGSHVCMSGLVHESGSSSPSGQSLSPSHFHVSGIHRPERHRKWLSGQAR